MRRGLTLIEMVFAIVIIAVVFMVVPRILHLSTRTTQLTIKEDALFDAMTLTSLIASLPWDQNTTESNGKILDAGGVECNTTTGYRIGGFVGSRNCIDGPYGVVDAPDGQCDDISDFANKACYSDITGGRVEYNLTTTIQRVADTKRIVVEVASSSAKVGGDFKSTFRYDSYNLGQIAIRKRWW